MKVINGNRKTLEKKIVQILMSDASNVEIDAEINKLKPVGRLKLVTTSQLPEKAQLSPQSLHQQDEDKI
ncbi:MAG: hypothetical protein HOE12_07050 [Gammaproteobacteria bacterium]|jgi:hypothetical protein|nr:hypothetical protein [Gammaproteobacteria bacterium]